MTNTEPLEKTLCLFTFLLALIVYSESHAVINFNSQVEDAQSFSMKNHRLAKRDATGDENCNSETQELENYLKSHKIDGEHTFSNESKYAMALAWAGENDGTLIIVTSQETKGVTNSTVYRSTNFGLDYDKLDDIKHPIKKHNGLQRNPTDSKKVYLVSEKQELYVTEDGGMKFTKVTLPFVIEDEIIFHPNKKFDSYLMAKNKIQDLYVSLDNGLSWRNIQNKTGKVFWGITSEDEPGKTCDTSQTIYVAVAKPINRSPFSPPVFTLKRTLDSGRSWNIILDWVASYERNGNFLYASVLTQPGMDDSNRLLKISKDCGKTWNDAQLPTIEPDRFYSVMDIESNMIFMHVDDPLDSGHGTLYTSSTSGVVYSESLPRHLYPNFGEIHDFYKVKSLRGVYITSQMNTDDSIHTVISYNRGATWEKIKRPPGVPCKDEKKECYLQIHGMYSLKRGINASPPLSQKTATGLIVAHGHVADALQKTDPDVFVSSDGGYNWRLALHGPHHYEIGDHGGLLVAISKQELEPKVIKFSTDEGRCWHEYTFTNESLRLTGLLTEPEGKSLVVMIWGYISTTRKWKVHIIDFKDVIKSKCSKQDYEPWLAHQSNSGYINDNTGCVLGKKETFLRLRKDSFCFNDYKYNPLSTVQQCKCTREDYECDYGYYRPGGSDKCVKILEFQRPEIDICLRGHEEKIVSEGYRKIPGDECKGGFTPSQSKLIDLSIVCDESSKSLVKEDEQVSPVGKMSKGVKIFAVFLVVIVLGLAAIMGVYFMRKYILLRRHRVEYRYSMLNQREDEAVQGNRDWSDDLDNALSSSSVNYQDSDEELTTSTIQPSKGRRTQPSRQNGAVKNKDTNPFGSYHDDSDDDLLS